MAERGDEVAREAVSTTSGSGQEPDFMALVDGLSPDLLARSLTHSSWVNERTDSYERLEFLGDSVLGLAIAGHLFQEYPAYSEGRLAKLKAYVVSRESCSLVARNLGIRELLLERAPAEPDQRRELAGNSTALGNVLEALIGAMYLELGYEVVRPAVVAAFGERIRYGRTRHVDFKSTLQEHLAAESPETGAVYRLVREEGPPHRRLFTSEVLVGGEPRGRGTGRSIKSSEQEAARVALQSLGVLDEEGRERPEAARDRGSDGGEGDPRPRP